MRRPIKIHRLYNGGSGAILPSIRIQSRFTFGCFKKSAGFDNSCQTTGRKVAPRSHSNGPRVFVTSMRLDDCLWTDVEVRRVCPKPIND
jgi:hypothetical protein